MIYNVFWTDVRDPVDPSRSEEGGLTYEEAHNMMEWLNKQPWFVDAYIIEAR